MKTPLRLTVFLSLLISIQIQAQPWVQNNGIFNPSGIPSLAFSQPRFADLDNDGDMDMILGNINEAPLYFENTGSANSPIFQSGANIFSVVDPLDAEMAVFYDLDADGDLDLISGGYTGINLYENTGEPENPEFEKVPGFFGGLSAGASPVPDFADLDDDGDLDMAVGLSESGMVKIYTNTGNESDAQFSEDDFYELADVGLYAYPAFVDMDNDEDMDLLVGRDGFGFYFYENTGSAQSADWEEDEFVFDGLGMDTYWNSPDFVDLNGNGTYDLIFGTSSGPLKYFDNSGTDEEPAWQENTSLFGGVIDIGGASNPVFFDYDNDGDLDMFTGSQMGDIKYFQNTGTTSGPSWNENSAPFNSLKHSIYSAVAIGDVNNDGNPDAIVGDLSGNLYYHRYAGLSFVFESSFLTDIALGGWSAPRLVDFDEDNDLDIIAGAEDGTLTYIENIGDAENPDWVEVDGVFPGIDVGSNCVPTLVDVDFDGDLDLLCGNLFGDLNFYENVEGEWIENADFVGAIEVDQNSTPAFGDLDGDGDPDLIIGEYGGTFSYYENRLMVVGQNEEISSSNQMIRIYPNPSQNEVNIQWHFSEEKDIQMDIFNQSGVCCYSKMIDKSDHLQRINLDGFSSGVYILRITTDTEMITNKIVKQ